MHLWVFLCVCVLVECSCACVCVCVGWVFLCVCVCVCRRKEIICIFECSCVCVLEVRGWVGKFIILLLIWFNAGISHILPSSPTPSFLPSFLSPFWLPALLIIYSFSPRILKYSVHLFSTFHLLPLILYLFSTFTSAFYDLLSGDAYRRATLRRSRPGRSNVQNRYALALRVKLSFMSLFHSSIF